MLASGILEVNEQGCRSRCFWVEPEPFFRSGSGSCSYSYSYTVNILFLRDPKVILTLIVYTVETMRVGSRLTIFQDNYYRIYANLFGGLICITRIFAVQAVSTQPVLRSRSTFDRLRLQVLFFTGSGSGSSSYKNRLKSSKTHVFAFTSLLRLRPKKYRLRLPQHCTQHPNTAHNSPPSGAPERATD